MESEEGEEEEDEEDWEEEEDKQAEEKEKEKNEEDSREERRGRSEEHSAMIMNGIRRNRRRRSNTAEYLLDSGSGSEYVTLILQLAHATGQSILLYHVLLSFHFSRLFILIYILICSSFNAVVGVLLGMAYKAGISCRLDLPLIIQQILYSTSSSPPPFSCPPSSPSISLSGKSKRIQKREIKNKSDLFFDDFVCSAGWCLRLGITTMYPEVGDQTRFYKYSFISLETVLLSFPFCCWRFILYYLFVCKLL